MKVGEFARLLTTLPKQITEDSDIIVAVRDKDGKFIFDAEVVGVRPDDFDPKLAIISATEEA